MGVRLYQKFGSEIKSHSFLFPGGETQVQIKGGVPHSETIVVEATKTVNLFEIALWADAVRRSFPGNRVELKMPYLPYARQDRVCAVGESLSLKVACDFINSLKFDAVEVWDVHSDVALALLDRVTHIPQSVFVQRLPMGFNSSGPILVCPDSGASKKTYEIAKITGARVIKADKIRNPSTGDITGTVIHSGPVGDADLLVVDDICDGGRTFVELGKVIKSAELTKGKVYLYVTHGIFSKGFGELLMYYDHIYTANLIGPEGDSKCLTVIQ